MKPNLLSSTKNGNQQGQNGKNMKRKGQSNSAQGQPPENIQPQIQYSKHLNKKPQNQPKSMITKTQIIAAITILIILFSSFFLSRLLITQMQYLMQSSKPRLTLFLILHLYVIVMMVWFTRLEENMEFVIWAFWTTCLIGATMCGVEVYVYVNKQFNSLYNIRTVLPLELAYLNCYFLLYMYSLITSFLTGMFWVLTKLCIYIQQKRIKKAIRQSIIPIVYTPQLREQQCAICLAPFEANQYLLIIKCQHKFHQQCLMEWIRVNQTCPTCRYHVFQALSGEEVDIQVVRNQGN